MDPLDFLLFTKIPVIESLTETFNVLAKKFLLPIFIISIIWEFASMRFDFRGVISRLIFAIVVINFYAPYHHGARKASMKIANSVLAKYGAKNKFMRGWKSVIKSKEGRQIRRKNKEEGVRFDGYFKNLVKSYSNDVVLGLLWVANYLSLMFVKILYTIVFHFAEVTAGISVVLAMLPFARDAAQGPIKASIWCFLVPIVISAILSAMGSLISPPDVDNGYLVYDAGTYTQMFIFSLLLLGSLTLVGYIISGKGPQEWASRMADKASTGLMLGGAGLALSKLKLGGMLATGGLGAGVTALGGATVGRGISSLGGAMSNSSSKFKDMLGDRASDYLEESGVTPTVGDLNKFNNEKEELGFGKSVGNSVDQAYRKTGSLRNSILSPSVVGAGAMGGMKALSSHGAGKFKRASNFGKSTNAKTKAIGALDRVANKSAVEGANAARNQFANTMKDNPRLQGLSLPNNAFRSEGKYNDFLKKNNINSAPRYGNLNNQPTKANSGNNFSKKLRDAKDMPFSSSDAQAFRNDRARVNAAWNNIKKINSDPGAHRNLPKSDSKDALMLAWSEFDHKSPTDGLIVNNIYHDMKDFYK